MKPLTKALLAAALLALGARAWALPAAPERYAVVARTPLFMTLTGHLTVGGAAAGAGAEVAVYDPQGILCGASGVDAANGGAFVLHLYGDDPTTAADEGLSAGDALRFEVWDAASARPFAHGEIVFQSAAFGSTPPAYPPPFTDRAAYTLDLDALGAAANRAPVLATIGNKSVDAGQALVFTVSASDADEDALAWAIGALPPGAAFTPATGVFAWTPDPTQSGAYTVTFTVTDDGTPSASDSETITVTVLAGSTNQPPVLAPIGAKSGVPGVALTFVVTATDPDGDPLTIVAAGLPAGATFARGTFAWTPGYAQAGSHTVTFTAADGSLSDSEAVVLTVTAANRAPVLAAIGAKQVAEGETLTFAVTATDPDGDPLTTVASGLPAGASFTGGAFSWTPTYDQAGSRTVIFTASDGNLSDSEAVTITVANVNRAPARPAIPSLTAAASDPLCRFSAALSQFSDPDAGARLTAIRWEVWQETPDLANVFRLDLDLATLPTELTLPLGILAVGAPYRLAVSYRDDQGAWSPSSQPAELPPAAADPRDLDGNGTQDDAEAAGAAPTPGTLTFQDPATGTRIELIPPAGTTVTHLYVTDRAELAAAVEEQMPVGAQIPFGLYSFRLEGVTPGAAAALTFAFPHPLPPDTAWFKVGATGTLDDVSPQVRFSADERAATLTLWDGGAGDADGLENGVIVDPSGPVTGAPALPPIGAVDSSGGTGGGCFLEALQSGR